MAIENDEPDPDRRTASDPTSRRSEDGDQCVAFRTSAGGDTQRFCASGANAPIREWSISMGRFGSCPLRFPMSDVQNRLGWVVEVSRKISRFRSFPPAPRHFAAASKRGGVEGDQTYYLANEKRIRGKDKINLKTDPPPDLAIEAVHSHDADAAVAVWRRFKVPEVWVCDEDELRILVLQPNGRYAQSPTSASFPFLSAAEIFDWVRRPQTASELEWLKAAPSVGQAHSETALSPNQPELRSRRNSERRNAVNVGIEKPP